MSQQETYRQLNELHQRLPLFFQPWWLDCFGRNWEVAIWEKAGSIKGVFPYFIEKKAGFRLLRNPLLCPYLGPYFIDLSPDSDKRRQEEASGIDALLQQIPSVDYFQLTTVPGFDNYSSFHQHGFKNSARQTYLLALSKTEEEIFAGFQSRMRSYTRKAEQELEIRTNANFDLDLFIQWQSKAYQDKGQSYPYTLAQIATLLKAAEEQQSGLKQVAYNSNGEPLAFLWTPFDKQKAYHLLAANDPEKKHHGAMPLLVWKAIKTLKEKRLMHYDFEGSMDKGIEHFFKKFGGKRLPYFAFEQTNSMLWRWKQMILG